ncbi:translation initiation factor IF-3 [Texas Phoenix palm phytoplasma]|uniref:Translation initiation factor IF-3 n=1 Tax=Texas Phoenix palm phytoplasma TaxID=176709 RepID=A0ABS5BIN7_9MOLU|nr:translation initiation factor IF-3 [Texas Phoenix palm phytoplasma]MBP3059448.1 translation initiation factor IF-3 [Texas Phoenix palm phytoplasma]
MDEEGKKIGILEKNKIIKLSEEKETDIVMINSDSSPKVVRLMNYSQFRYKQQKKLKEIKKKQHIRTLKEIRLNPNIDNNDLKCKIKQIYSFLKQKYKVKIMIRFKGRMIINHKKLGDEIIQKIFSNELLKEVLFVDVFPKMEGNQMTTILKLKNKINKNIDNK